MSTRGLTHPRSWAGALFGGTLALVAGMAPGLARADEPDARARVDRLSLDNGVRVVLVRTERAGPVAVAVAVRDTSATFGTDDPAALSLSEAAPRGELSVGERATLLTTRSVRPRAALTGLATVRSLVGPGDELPLLLYLTGQTLQDARWDETTFARASAHPTPPTSPASPASSASSEASRVFAVARERLFPRSPLPLGEAAATPLDRLRALDRTRTRLETVVTVVGDFDVDRAAELVHQHLDASPRRAPPAATVPRTNVAPSAPVALVAPTFAVTLALRIDGAPARRRALLAAFEVLSRTRLRGLRDSPSTLMVNELDEATAGARLVGLRVVVTDAKALRAATAEITIALGKLVAGAPTAAELSTANARLAVADELRALSPLARASETALAELAGERAAAGPTGATTRGPAEHEPTAASLPATLADGFGEAHRVILTEQPGP